jgi:hypothetical protein
MEPFRAQHISSVLLSATQPRLHISRQSLDQKTDAECLPGLPFATRRMLIRIRPTQPSLQLLYFYKPRLQQVYND